MNKKVFTLLTLTLLTASTSSTLAFSDVEGHWAEKEINKAAGMKIINGYSEDLFMPDANMTRAELVAVINRLLMIQSESDKYVPDISSQDWFHKDIRKAVAMGIIKGNQDGFVRPNDFVTREEAVVMLSRAFNITNTENILINTYDDASEVATWAKSEILTFIKEGYISGYGDNTIKPKNNISRAEVLTILDRVVNNILTTSSSCKITGKSLIRDRNVLLENVEIFGDLIISEVAVKTVTLNNVIIHGNLVLHAPFDMEQKSIAVDGEIIKVYENRVKSNLRYNSAEYGITFPLPDGAKAIKVDENFNYDNSAKDLIVINEKKDDSYYFRTINSISSEIIENQKYDSIYRKIESGKLKNYPYELYKDNANSRLLVIKRDNVVYSMLFLNIVSENIIDNILANIEFFNGTLNVNHDELIYRNSKLCLKFTYRNGYVGIDDSYNTGVVYGGDSFFKLFIQVNMITDMDKYSLSEKKMLLRTLAKNDGTIIDEEMKKIMTHDAIQFEIESEEDKIISLYVIVGNNLYNFIFKGTSEDVDSIGKDIFLEIINSMEF